MNSSAGGHEKDQVLFSSELEKGEADLEASLKAEEKMCTEQFHSQIFVETNSY